MGYVGFGFIVLIVPILAGIAVPVFAEVQLRGKETKSLSQAKQIAVACWLTRTITTTPFRLPWRISCRNICRIAGNLSVLFCRVNPLATIISVARRKDPPDKVLLISKFKDRRGKRIIAYIDGSAAVNMPPPTLPAPSH